MCNHWIHLKCNNTTSTEYNSLIEEGSACSWCCQKCINLAIPFSDIEKENFLLTNVAGQNPDICELDIVDFNIGTKNKELVDEISNMILHNQNLDPDEVGFPCEYYDIEKIIKSKFESTHFFSTIHHNIHSLQAHFEELKHLLQCVPIEFDIIALSEVKLLKGQNPVIDINIPNYALEYTPTEATKGGTAIYISKKHKYIQRKDLEIYIPKTIESTFVELVYPNSKNIIVGCVYKHHNISEEQFTNELVPILKKINKENKSCQISGDFNINLLNSVKKIENAHFFNNITSNNFMPTITLPTRITSKSKTLIDNILTNQYQTDMISGNITVGISDHIPQFLLTPTKKYKLHNLSKNVLKRSFRNVDMVSMKHDLENIDWSFSNERDPNNSLQKLFTETNKVFDRYAPLRKVPKKELKLEATPWITKGIQNSIQRKDKLYKKMIKEKNSQQRKILEKSYKTLKQKIFNIIRSSKKLHYKTYFEKCTNNAKKIWAGVNEIIRNKTKNVDSIDHVLGANGNSITSKIEISHEFNSFFSGVAGNLLRERRYGGYKDFMSYLTNPIANSLHLSPANTDEIISIIFAFNPNKSNGPHSIPGEIFKRIAYILAVPLRNICNTIFETGIYPNILKLAKVIVIHKKGSKAIVSNYRPISLLSNVNKIFEKLIYKRLYGFLETNDSIYDLQFGFREKHSAADALITIVDRITQYISTDVIAVGVFVDFQKAFDTVNHEILLKKLEHYGIRGVCNNLIRSYLNNRHQYVSLEGVDSYVSDIEHGVPQGSVLGPLLFLIYINDLHNAIHNSDTYHFADDTHLLHFIKKHNGIFKTRKLNIDLKSLNHWLLANKISLNAAKTEVVLFRKPHVKTIQIKPIKLNGIRLEAKSKVKYLGVMLDEFLTWDTQINEVISKLKRANNLLAISRHYVPSEVLKQIYFAQFHSNLIYCCQVWGQKLGATSQISILQKKAIRLLCWAPNAAHSSPLFKSASIVKISDQIKLLNILYTYKIIHQDCPKTLLKNVCLTEQAHSHETRNNPNSSSSIPKGSIKTNSKSLTNKNSVNHWNQALKQMSSIYVRENQHAIQDGKLSSEYQLHTKSLSNLKLLLKSHFINSY